MKPDMLHSSLRVMKTPRTVDIAITNGCNLRCTYCYHFSSAGDVGKDLPTEEWLRFFRELKRCAVMDVALAGGEPFLRKDLEELVDGIVENNMRFSILSNGTLITHEMAAFLHSTGRCDHVQVSLDGSRPEIHDACRGKGAFNLAVRGIEYLCKNAVPVTVRATIHHSNVSDLEDMARFLLEELRLDGFSTNAASYMGLLRENMDQAGLRVEDRILAMESLVRLNRKYYNRIGAQAGPLAEAGMWAEMIEARDQGSGQIPGRGYLTACGCVMDKIAVRADGVIVPCTMLSHMELGRINRDDFQSIWHYHPEMIKMRERRNIPLTDFEFCDGCEYINFCTGNCPGLAYSMVGKVNHPSPDACLQRFLENGGRLPAVVMDTWLH